MYFGKVLFIFDAVCVAQTVPDSNLARAKGFYFSSKLPDRLWVPGFLIGVKRQGREGNYSHPSVPKSPYMPSVDREKCVQYTCNGTVRLIHTATNLFSPLRGLSWHLYTEIFPDLSLPILLTHFL